MLRVEQISKIYSGGLRAVDAVSFDVNPGEILGIVGPNGAGKTTTIRMILNIIQPDEGRITLNGGVIGEAAKNMLGYLPEERGLYKKSTIENVLTYMGMLKELNPAILKERIGYWLKMFELEGMNKRKIEELSKGNQQKIQFIAAVLHNPDVIIFDEPFSGLDPINQLLFRDAVKQLRNEGKTIVFCTHQLESAELLCDRIFMIHKGKRVLYGKFSEIQNQYGTEKVQIGFRGEFPDVDLQSATLVEKNDYNASLELYTGKTLNDLLSELIGRVDIVKAEQVSPSLLNIFVSIVGDIYNTQNTIENNTENPL